VKEVVFFIFGIHGMCWESMWRLWSMLLEEFVALVVFPLGDMEERAASPKVIT
jgi:hypothetical protein